MSVAELVEFNDDGEARVECVCTAGDPARGLEAAETRSGHTKTSRFQRWLRQSRRALEFLLVGSLQRSKAARLPGDWPEE